MSDYSESEQSESESETEEVLPVKPQMKEKAKDSDEGERVSETSGSEDENDDDSALSSDEDINLSDEDDEEPLISDEMPMEANKPAKKAKKQKPQPAGDDDDDTSLHLGELELSDEEDDEEGSQYLHQFDEQVKEQLIANHHPELLLHNYDEVEALTHVTRDTRGIIIDPLHRTLPFLTKYEKTRILGERAKQLNGGAKAFIETNPTIIDGYLIAHAELEQKKIPFIIRRPLNNGGSEYWKLSDLEII
jgi:DNA-directed RNA polymerase subunit K/omega